MIPTLISSSQRHGGSMNYTTKLFRNNGNRTFIEQAVSLPAIVISDAAWGDYDNDGRLGYFDVRLCRT